MIPKTSYRLLFLLGFTHQRFIWQEISVVDRGIVEKTTNFAGCVGFFIFNPLNPPYQGDFYFLSKNSPVCLRIFSFSTIFSRNCVSFYS